MFQIFDFYCQCEAASHAVKRKGWIPLAVGFI